MLFSTKTPSCLTKSSYFWSGARPWKKTPASTTFYFRTSHGSILGEYAGAVSSLKYLMLPGAGGTTEGQWEMNGTTFMAEYFYITDHLGNNRVSVKNNGGTPLVTGKTDYYPYGSVSREC
ncbi:MAG: hypothetical protein HUU10_14190 [Bacteroidetes bacterium]|nr:hypothetical protein [Bacteroidota bacterium]